METKWYESTSVVCMYIKMTKEELNPNREVYLHWPVKLTGNPIQIL